MYNHPCDEWNFNVHAVNRQLTGEHIIDFFRDECSTFSVLIKPVALRKYCDDDYYTPFLIYFTMQKLCVKSPVGRTPIQMLIDTITPMEEYKFDVHYNANGELMSFFFVHEESWVQFNRFPTVLILDSTYKTNRLKMPFLEAVGMTSNNRTFFLCGCFMTKEATADYTWAVTKMKEFCFIDASPDVIATDNERALILAINQVLPETQTLLCRWRIEKNLLAKLSTMVAGLSEARRTHILRVWTNAVHNSYTEEQWDLNFTAFADLPEFEMRDEDGQPFPTELDDEGNPVTVEHPSIAYVKQTWIPERRKFVSAWTSRTPHLGSCNTSRVEGAHAYLKSYIEASNLDIDRVFLRVNAALCNQFVQLDTHKANDRLRDNTYFRNRRIFNSVVSKISKFALNKVRQQF